MKTSINTHIHTNKRTTYVFGLLFFVCRNISYSTRDKSILSLTSCFRNFLLRAHP
ncbi:unnamed protein product [Schistosoma mattheei]|uniref:Uncharacterized protein n=1 Tax=Schistosoma mattheei TaxID=31246 RepID=A0A183PUC4_9TREM|nr:unnamed protein product [Schistosoma mattheei]